VEHSPGDEHIVEGAAWCGRDTLQRRAAASTFAIARVLVEVLVVASVVRELSRTATVSKVATNELAGRLPLVLDADGLLPALDADRPEPPSSEAGRLVLPTPITGTSRVGAVGTDGRQQGRRQRRKGQPGIGRWGRRVEKYRADTE